PAPAPVPEPAPVPGSVTPAPPVVAGAKGGLPIDPRAVALDSLDLEPRRVAPQDQPPEETAAERDRRMSAVHSAALAAEANARPWDRRRAAPELERQKDGSYLYEGGVFAALIEPDGSVEFSDRGGMHFKHGGAGESIGATMGFDATDAMYRRHGEDPYRAERRWFMRETRDLRDRLATEHRAQVADAGVARLRRRLVQIWSDSSRPVEARRAAIFRIWDALAEGEAGARAREAVLGFVRSRLPEGSPAAFPPGQLAALNRARSGGPAFDPY
ncbi:MAG: hypothetical protein KC543_13790, partial [Myxococcales bacterium]|nr:hypothetical protein [Myxococcales bacterium]